MGGEYVDSSKFEDNKHHTIIFSCQISVSKQAKSMLVFYLLYPTSFFLYICIKLSELLADLVHNRLLVYWASINYLSFLNE